MKRTQLIEWGVVTISLIFGYKFLEGTISYMVQVIYAYGDIDLGKLLLRFILICGSYGLGFILLVRNSSLIAKWINGPSENDNLNIKISKRSLLQVILIGVCIATILVNIAEIIFYLVESFKNEAGGIHEPADKRYSNHLFKLAAIKVIIAFLVLYFSNNISGWFIRKNEADELIFDSNTKN